MSSLIRRTNCRHSSPTSRSVPLERTRSITKRKSVIRNHLAVSYLHAWNDDSEQSGAELQKAQALAPADIGLLIQVAMRQTDTGRFAKALALVDAFEPLNRTEMQDRELVALNIAVQMGKLDRARTAAERLFGLRLSDDIELLLAQQMNQLGMFELSETVMGRARRKAGRNAGSLRKLMQQYNSQGKKRPGSGSRRPAGCRILDDRLCRSAITTKRIRHANRHCGY